MEDIKDVQIKKYEIALLVHPGLEEAEAETYFSAIEKKVKDAGGSITTAAKPVRMALAYTLKKQTEGYFGFAYFEAGPEAILKLSDDLKHEKNLLRFMIIKNDFGSNVIAKESTFRRAPSKASSETEEVASPAIPAVAAPVRSLDNAELERKLEEILQ